MIWQAVNCICRKLLFKIIELRATLDTWLKAGMVREVDHPMKQQQ
jgi:hypothetical protein